MTGRPQGRPQSLRFSTRPRKRNPSGKSPAESIALAASSCANRSRWQAFLVNFDQCLQPRSLILTIDNALPGRRGKITLRQSNVKSNRGRYQMKQSTKDEIDGNLQATKGTIKETVGQVTHNPNLTAQGQNEKLAGKVQRKVGQIEKVLEK